MGFDWDANSKQFNRPCEHPGASLHFLFLGPKGFELEISIPWHKANFEGVTRFTSLLKVSALYRLNSVINLSERSEKSTFSTF
jgi:hypothetical protein